MRYFNWFVAEFSTIITDLPEVIGIGIACNLFFGWPYYVGVIFSLVTTMLFLAFLSCGIRFLEATVVLFVGCMSIALFTEMSFVGSDASALSAGWAYGFTETKSSDLFSITGILGAVVMPHNLYLHTAACQSRKVQRVEAVVRQAVHLSSLEPVVPIMFSFFVNMSIVAIAAESVYGTGNASEVGLTDFCDYFKGLKGGCVLWGIALLAAGQSSAITTTFTGQYVMDGFLDVRLPTWLRATATRLLAIAPCVLVSVLLPDRLNQLVNFVNSALALLLPFAFTPLVKYTTSVEYMGRFAPPRWEQLLLKSAAFAVYFINAISLSAPGGGFFGFLFEEGGNDVQYKGLLWLLMIAIQSFYLWWNINCMRTPISQPMTPIEEERVDEKGEFALAGVMT